MFSKIALDDFPPLSFVEPDTPAGDAFFQVEGLIDIDPGPDHDAMARRTESGFAVIVPVRGCRVGNFGEAAGKIKRSRIR
jgi:hypothetical protein